MKHLWRQIAGSTVALTALGSPAAAATLQVGPGQTYAMPCDAIAAAQAGDTIQVDAAGSYDGNTCAWSTDGLTVMGINGRAKIDLTGVTPAEQKGIFTIEGTASATIESFELSGASVSSGAGNNGAGIRHQGLNLTVRNCFIHDNQDGILGAPATANTGTVLIESSELSSNGAGDGYTHNIYIGNYATFTLQYSWSHLANVGHLVKSRAFTTLILYNRLTDELGGTASYETDIPYGGTAYVIGNLIEQSAASMNPAIITFGEEGSPAGYDTHLFVVNNSVLNDLGSGTYVVDSTTTPAVITNNVFHGGGTDTSQSGATLTTNFDDAMGNPMFADAASYDLSLLTGSPCIDKGTMPGSSGAQSLVPDFEYVQPLSEIPRAVVGAAIDIGAYEYGLSLDAGVLGPDASPDDAAPAEDAGGGSDAGDAGTAPVDASSGTDSGTGADSGVGADSGAGADSGTRAGDAGAPASAPAKSGCGCAVAGAPAGAGGLVAGLLLAMVAVARRRRT